MSDFNKTNKVSGVHWLKNPINSLNIRIKLTQHNGISLPHYEEYTNSDTNLRGQDDIEEHTFKWQQKVFSTWEMRRYSDPHNCITDAELNFHEIIKNSDSTEPSKIFTYINDEDIAPFTHENKLNRSHSYNSLNCFKSNICSNRIGRYIDKSLTSSMGNLIQNEDSISDEDDRWVSMHIVFDNSEYNEDSQILVKEEATLLTLHHNVKQNILILSPDENDLKWNPYTVETSSGLRWNYNYSVAFDFGDDEDEESRNEELRELLRKLQKKWYKKNKATLNFTTPSIGTKRYYLTVEIVKAVDFEMDNLYVEFNIKFPESATFSEDLQGKTHTTKAISVENKTEWNFGHILEFSLEDNVDAETPPMLLYFEVISVDWWCRRRTEGYAFLRLALRPGRGHCPLSCVRPEETDPLVADSRRYFVGGCNLIKDVSVLSAPKTQETNYRYVSTGRLCIRWDIVTHSHKPGALYSVPIAKSTGASATALLRGAEVVLKQYKKARERLAKATKGLRADELAHHGSGDGAVEM